MAKADPDRIAAILRDEDFQAVMTALEEGFVAMAVSPTTKEGPRAQALADYHAVLRIRTALRNAAKGTTK